jgi:hypothetical protein
MPSTFKIEPPYYPIVYVRGYAMTASEREDVFHDAYYGFSATSVEKRQSPPPRFFEADIFEGQFVRLMKLRDYSYADASNRGEQFHANPSRSIWISRFYDLDYIRGQIRPIETHAEDDLWRLIRDEVPERLEAAGVNLGANRADYKVILIAHSMGGLVCRTLIQNIMPGQNEDPKRWIHRLVTMGTPHRGIDLDKVPDFLERVVTTKLNPGGSNIFQEARMREYLKLGAKDAEGNYVFDIHSLGAVDGKYSLPVKRCLCLIGSDYHSYSAVQYVTGAHSDGLVKQDRAYMVSGTHVDGDYPEQRRAYWANVHRAHSGYRGIVNSYESFENLHRFLFGDTRASVALENIEVKTPPPAGVAQFYDFEILVTIRNTTVFLHRREQDPCENAIRYDRSAIPPRILLHTGFLNSRLRDPGQAFSHFAITLRIIEHQLKQGLLWDHEYPGRPVFTETLEIRIGSEDGTQLVHFRWLSETADWAPVDPDNRDVYRIPLRSAHAVAGILAIETAPWPEKAVTMD